MIPDCVTFLDYSESIINIHRNIRNGKPINEKDFNQLPLMVKFNICYQIFLQQHPGKSKDDFQRALAGSDGDYHGKFKRAIYEVVNKDRVQRAIENVAFEFFDELAPAPKQGVAYRVWVKSGSPPSDDPVRWGEDHARDNVEILLSSIDGDNSLSLEIINALDEWETRGRASEKRMEAVRRILRFLSSQFMSTLDLSDLNLEDLPPIFDKEPIVNRLSELNLNNNRLEALPLDVCHIEQLTVLRLNKNKLTHLPPEIGMLEGLEELYLEKNYGLTQVPTQIFSLPFGCKINLEVSSLTLSTIKLISDFISSEVPGPSFNVTPEVLLGAGG